MLANLSQEYIWRTMWIWVGSGLRQDPKQCRGENQSRVNALKHIFLISCTLRWNILLIIVVINIDLLQVLQFDCLNTLSDQLLENVRVQLEPSEGYTMLAEIPCSKLPYNETGTAYVVLRYPENDLSNSVGTFGAVLKFLVKDCDPATGLPDTDEGNYNKNIRNSHSIL